MPLCFLALFGHIELEKAIQPALEPVRRLREKGCALRDLAIKSSNRPYRHQNLMNHLEQIVGEWYEYSGYFVRRNVLVGKRANGGYEGELDIVAFNPQTDHLVHIEPSLDADSWRRREERFSKKFQLGRTYIPELFSGIEMPDQIDQIALFVFASNTNQKQIGGGMVATAAEFYAVVAEGLRRKRVASAAVPEQYALLRTVQHCLEYSKAMASGTSSSNLFLPTLSGLTDGLVS